MSLRPRGTPGARRGPFAVLCLLAAILAGPGCGKTSDDLGVGSSSSDCKPPAMLCGKSCTVIATDPDHCGACGTACPAGDQCVRGACTSTKCPAGQTDCGGLCVDPMTNPLNCGACNVACTPPEVCDQGACECTGTARSCGGVCTDVESSADNCGDCGHPCSAGESCSGGTCVSMCQPGQTWCPAGCRDLTSSITACGACGNACKDGEVCRDGRCECPTDESHAVCGGVCTDVSSDNSNCGACGKACPAGNTCSVRTCVSCGISLFFCPAPAGDPLAACVSQAQTVKPPAGGPDGESPPLSPDPTCQCQHCLVELQDCESDPMCISAYKCATAGGCIEHCFDTMSVCSMSGGSVGGCWKFCPPTTISTQAAARAEALLRCTTSNGCRI